MFGLNSSDGFYEILDGIKIKSINHGTNMIMTEFHLSKGAILPEHSHIYEQSGYLVQGKIRLSVNGQSQELNKGDSWNIPGGIMHKAEILINSIAVEVFSPLREDYLKYLNIENII
jgi:quercetin dioxygenase-like cupin family protein